MNLNQAKTEKGFTLIEVLVALTIVAISLPALMFSISTQVNQLTYVEQKLLGQWIASNEMAKLNTKYRQTGAIVKGKRSGVELMAGQKWSWNYKATEESSIYAKGIFAVTIDVFSEEQPDSPIVTQLNSHFDKNAKVENLAELLNRAKQEAN